MVKGQPIKSELKVKVAFEAIKAQQTVSAIASKYGVHPAQVSAWKRQLLKQAALIFDDKRTTKDKPVSEDKLYAQIERLKVEVEWLKKNIL